jgi:hypothetical protein
MKPDPRLYSSMLTPAEGIEPASALFSQSPIEALDWLRELGDIARASLEPPAPDTSLSESLAPAPAADEPAPQAVPAAAAPKSEDSRLIEALLEYHRLRNPAVRAKSPAPATSSADPQSGFTPLDIPIVSDAAPKEGSSGRRANEPLNAILRPKART